MKKVLLVEDDERLSALIKQFLQENEFEVLALPDGNNILPHTQKFNPDIIILDVMLPGDNGFTL